MPLRPPVTTCVCRSYALMQAFRNGPLLPLVQLCMWPLLPKVLIWSCLTLWEVCPRMVHGSSLNPHLLQLSLLQSWAKDSRETEVRPTGSHSWHRRLESPPRAYTAALVFLHTRHPRFSRMSQEPPHVLLSRRPTLFVPLWSSV